MTTTRLPVPSDIADEVLYRNDHACCICNVPRKHVQIHHIDGNPLELALSYEKKEIAVGVIKVYTEALDSCKTGEQADFLDGILVLGSSAKRLARKLERSRVRWPQVTRKLRAVSQAIAAEHCD